MFGTFLLGMGRYALQFIVYDKTLTQDKDKSSVKKGKLMISGRLLDV